MSAQPEALRLATILEIDLCEYPVDDAAAELRRLHAEHEALRNAVAKLHAARGRYHTQLAACDLYDLCGLPNERPAK